MATEKLQEKIREEIRRRVIEQDFQDQQDKEAADHMEALIEALQSVTDLPPEEIRHIADETRVQYLGEQVRRKRRRRFIQMVCGFVGIICLIGIAALFMGNPGKEPERFTRIEETPSVVEAERKPLSAPVERRDVTDAVSKSATPFRISLSQNGFHPVGMKMAVVGHASVRISSNRAPEITRVPDFEGNIQQFGVLRLGIREDDRFPFVFDLLPSGRPVMYVDINQNGDLTDDGDPRANQGTGWFATAVEIPFDRLVNDRQVPGTYRTWLFMKEKLWESGVFRRYSFTQLQGNVVFDGEEYETFIADSYTHDADYTNDGIGIDLDRNGKIDRETEFFPPNAAASIGGRRYVFDVDW